MTHDDEPELLTSQEVAELLHRDRKTVQRWAAAGKLPYAAKVRGQRGAWLYERRSIERFAEELHGPSTKAY
ncbi:helix-turn-helix domain-containing protein [Isoptericola sp. NPDC058082]|uniref:helix-turn-helix domain-containing protein n=1 Tax=Isoptericola sp. NPDC058082 TaxID=3346331 RepID=UPI0036EEE4DB